MPYKDKKSKTISRWKKYGLIDDYDRVFAIWEDATECMKCEKAISGHGKCMDHDHDTGLYREILCRACNNGNLLDLTPTKHNKLQEKYITSHQKRFRFRKKTGGHTFRKTFDTLGEAIKYREEYIWIGQVR